MSSEMRHPAQTNRRLLRSCRFSLRKKCQPRVSSTCEEPSLRFHVVGKCRPTINDLAPLARKFGCAEAIQGNKRIHSTVAEERDHGAASRSQIRFRLRRGCLRGGRRHREPAAAPKPGSRLAMVSAACGFCCSK